MKMDEQDEYEERIRAKILRYPEREYGMSGRVLDKYELKPNVSVEKKKKKKKKKVGTPHVIKVPSARFLKWQKSLEKE